MSNLLPRPNTTNIVAACILSVGLIAAAAINAHRVEPVRSGIFMPGGRAKALTEPPIAQESAISQIEQKALASPQLKSFMYVGKAYTLTDFKVTLLRYDAEKDTFEAGYDARWWSNAPGHDDSDLQSGFANLTNDGYGHYFGTIGFLTGSRGMYDSDVNITIR